MENRSLSAMEYKRVAYLLVRQLKKLEIINITIATTNKTIFGDKNCLWEKINALKKKIDEKA